jgi:hypothetical protein
VESNGRVVDLIRLGQLIDMLVPYSVNIMSYVYILNVDNDCQYK